MVAEWQRELQEEVPDAAHGPTLASWYHFWALSVRSASLEEEGWHAFQRDSRSHVGRTFGSRATQNIIEGIMRKWKDREGRPLDEDHNKIDEVIRSRASTAARSKFVRRERPGTVDKPVSFSRLAFAYVNENLAKEREDFEGIMSEKHASARRQALHAEFANKPEHERKACPVLVGKAPVHAVVGP